MQNIYAETTFVCPSYWMAEAYSDKGRSSYKYQYSVLPAVHGSDVTAYFTPEVAYQGPDFALAFQSMYLCFSDYSWADVMRLQQYGAISLPKTTPPSLRPSPMAT